MPNLKKPFGVGSPKMALSFSGSTWRPFSITIWSRNWILVKKKEFFDGFILKLASRKPWKFVRRREMCSSAVLSIYGKKVSHLSPEKTCSMRLWKVLRLPVKPIGILSHLKEPKVVVKAVFSWLSLSTGDKYNPAEISVVGKQKLPPRASKVSSGDGIGQKSLTVCLLGWRQWRTRRSFPSLFGTNMAGELSGLWHSVIRYFSRNTWIFDWRSSL